MNTATMKNWSVYANQEGLVDQGLLTYRLQGMIYGDSRGSFPDGSYIHTSAIRKITDCGTHKLIETGNSIYAIYREDVDPEYERQFPGAFANLKGEKVQ